MDKTPPRLSAPIFHPPRGRHPAPNPREGNLRAFGAALGRSAVALLALCAASPPTAADTRPTKTLEECVEIALRSHPTLGAAEASVDAGRARVRQARAGYLPNLDASFAADRRKTSPSALNPSSALARGQRFSFYSSGVTFSQVLFDFGENLHAMRAARARQASLEADEATDRLQVVLDVEQSYFDLLAARRLLRVADETVRQVDKQAEQARGRVEVGLAPKIDVTRSEVQRATAELDRITARNNLAIADDTLRKALGMSEPLDFEIEDVLDQPSLAPREPEALATAYEARPELESLRAQQRATEEDIASRRRSSLPNVSANAAYDWNGSSYPLRSGWNVGASVNLQIANGGRTTAQIAESEANLRALRFEEERERQQIALEVRTALRRLEESAERIGVARRGAEQARENLALAEGRYGAGVGNVIELSDAQAARTSADATYVRALYSRRIALAELERSTGSRVAP